MHKDWNKDIVFCTKWWNIGQEMDCLLLSKQVRPVSLLYGFGPNKRHPKWTLPIVSMTNVVSGPSGASFFFSQVATFVLRSA